MKTHGCVQLHSKHFIIGIEGTSYIHSTAVLPSRREPLFNFERGRVELRADLKVMQEVETSALQRIEPRSSILTYN
jgi:hypothetical protein